MTMNRPAILDRLRGVERAGKGWLSFCPVHNDQHKRSLSVGLGEDGRTLLKCHAAGCTIEQITAAVSMTVADLAPPSGNGHRASPEHQITARYDYRDERGGLLFQVVRYAPKDFRCRRPEGNLWVWNLDGVRVVPYRLHELAEAARVFIPEGEKDCDTLADLGLIATCNHGGAGKWREEHTRALVAAAGPEVVVLRDADAAGEAHQRSVATSCAASGLALVKVLELPDLPAKGDVSHYVDAQRVAGRTDDEIRVALLALAVDRFRFLRFPASNDNEQIVAALLEQFPNLYAAWETAPTDPLATPGPREPSLDRLVDRYLAPFGITPA